MINKFLQKIPNFSLTAGYTNGDLKNAFSKAENIVRTYYIVLFYIALTKGFSNWLHYLQVYDFDMLWPVRWLQVFPITSGINFIFILFIFGACLAAIFPHYRIARFIAFLGLLEFAALDNSFGKINHGLHVWILTSFFFVFLPGRWVGKLPMTRATDRGDFLFVMWGAQAIVLLTYTMAGILKVFGAVSQISTGQIHALHPLALALHISNRLIETNSISLLGPFIIEHPWIGWMFFTSGIYLEFFSFYIAFRPPLHKAWALGLVFLHIGIFLTMSIAFWENALLLLLLFLYSPFIKSTMNWRKALFDLPIFGFLFNKINKHVLP